MKTKKLSSGNYRFEHRGYWVTVSKVEGHSNWFYTYQRGDEFYGAEDWYSTKNVAIKASIELINTLAIRNQ